LRQPEFSQLTLLHQFFDQAQDPFVHSAAHKHPSFEVPFGDFFTVSKDMDMPWVVVTLVRDENVAAAPYFPHISFFYITLEGNI
jgi:hypothetical protein